jgi:predicted nuclease of predicted toxin-antitoxin system
VRFLVDESTDARLVGFVADRGHDGIFIVQSHGLGLSDSRILSIARESDRIVITDDRDFGDLVYRQRQPHAGVVYFRLRDRVWEFRMERMAYVLDRHAAELNERKFLVVTDLQVRIGPPPAR